MSYHEFRNENGEEFGSFETFFTCGSFDQEAEDSHSPGWYWQAGFPGCLPDGEPSGPFETEQEAIKDATDYV